MRRHLFDHVSPASALAREEIFGPVLPMIRVSGPEEAFEVANSTRYGLAASLFTENPHLVNEFIQNVESGWFMSTMEPPARPMFRSEV